MYYPEVPIPNKDVPDDATKKEEDTTTVMTATVSVYQSREIAPVASGSSSSNAPLVTEQVRD